MNEIMSGLSAFELWIIVGLLLGIIEIFTSGFAIICFSFGCFFAGLASLVGLSSMWQLLFFSAGTLLSFIFARPVLLRFFYQSSGSAVKMNAEALIGRRVCVVEAIESGDKGGLVKIDGEIWRAVSREEGAIEKDSWVEIESINNIILTVKRM